MHPITNLRRDALTIYHAALTSVAPALAMREALARVAPESRSVWLIGLGKAAVAMTGAAVEHLTGLSTHPAGGLVVTTPDQVAPVGDLPVGPGDHPIPGPRSLAAAEVLGSLTGRIGTEDEVWILLSGGTSSLIAAPVTGVPGAAYLELHGLLARAGLPIDQLNAIRKRFSRWGAGRLLGKLPGRRVVVFALSDVPGAVGDIGSGPCEPDPWTAADVRRLLEGRSLWSAFPAAARDYLERVVSGAEPETPKPDDPIFARRSTLVVADNHAAVTAACAAARALGYQTDGGALPLAGEAAEVGRALGSLLKARTQAEKPIAIIRGGETTVSLSSGAGVGGRCQELGLAAAEVFAGAEPDLVLLAAGTDGRDGPTDAAGAVVDQATWASIAAAGIDPATALARHDAYPALDAVGALLRTGSTGTNVMDLVIGLAGGGAGQEPAPAGP